MHVIRARNVCDAYAAGLAHLRAAGAREESRAGPVLVAPTPVTTVYENPRERVLMDQRRDANPFFHLFESLWLLAGRDDARWLDRFISDFSLRFAETGGRLHGSYGARWRGHFTAGCRDQSQGEPKHHGDAVDQLDEAVRLLRYNPDDRQVVLAMWDPSADLGVPGLKDRPCNTHAYLRVRMDTRRGKPEDHPSGTWTDLQRPVLDLTVCCRSNDAIWGCFGANAVQFSVLLEYLAGRIGVGVGRYYQVSHNFHAYVDALEKVGEPLDVQPYAEGDDEPLRGAPMGEVWGSWDVDLREFMEWTETGLWMPPANRWFRETASPMWLAHSAWRDGAREEALELAGQVAAPDWRAAALAWMRRRMR